MALFSSLRQRFQQRPATPKLGGGGLFSLQPQQGPAGELNRQRLATQQSMQQNKQVNQKLAQQKAALDSMPKPEMGGDIPKVSPPIGSSNPPLAPTFQPDQLQAMQDSLAKLSGDVGKFQQPTPQAPVTQPTSNEDLEKFLGLLKPTSEEEATKKQLANILASRELGLTNLEGEPIPLSAALGETGRIERRAQAMAIPLQEQLAGLQARRESALEAGKLRFGVEEKRAEREEGRRRFDVESGLATRKLEEGKTQTEFENKLAQQKFDEDRRQFGESYALKQQEIGLKARESGLGTAGVGITPESGTSLQLINELLPKAAELSGVVRTGAFTGSKAKLDQLIANLSVNARKLIKGQGAVSDYEAQILSDSTNALGKGYFSGKLSEQNFTNELKRIRGVVNANAGLPVSVNVKDPRSGQEKVGTLGRDEIFDAASQGFIVTYL